jgi:hypothetical protein
VIPQGTYDKIKDQVIAKQKWRRSCVVLTALGGEVITRI